MTMKMIRATPNTCIMICQDSLEMMSMEMSGPRNMAAPAAAVVRPMARPSLSMNHWRTIEVTGAQNAPEPIPTKAKQTMYCQGCLEKLQASRPRPMRMPCRE